MIHASIFLIMLAVIIVIVGIWQRISWWNGKKKNRLSYFPIGARNCRMIYDNLPAWWQKTKEHITYKPKNASVIGLFCLPIWPCIIFLNVIFLAQILEIVIPGGGRFELPRISVSYQVFPFILGILYAVGETILGVAFGHAKSKKGKVGLIVALSIMIIVEAGLAGWRTWLMTSGEEAVSTSFLDKWMATGGIWLGFLLGFVIPIIETVSGYLAFLNFMEPIMTSGLRWVMGFLEFLWCTLCWWFCGFYDIRPPETKFEERDDPPVAKKKFPKEVIKWENASNELFRNAQKMQGGLAEFDNKPQDFGESLNKLSELEKNIELKIIGWREIRIKPDEKPISIKELSDMVEQNPISKMLKWIKRRIKCKKKEICDEERVIIRDDIEPNEAVIANLPKKIANWNRKSDQFQESLQQSERDHNIISDQYNRLKYNALEYSELNQVIDHDKKFANIDNNLTETKKLLEKLREEFNKIGNVKIKAIQEHDLVVLEQKFKTIRTNIARKKREAIDDLNDIQSACGSKFLCLLQWLKKKFQPKEEKTIKRLPEPSYTKRGEEIEVTHENSI